MCHSTDSCAIPQIHVPFHRFIYPLGSIPTLAIKTVNRGINPVKDCGEQQQGGTCSTTLKIKGEY